MGSYRSVFPFSLLPLTTMALQLFLQILPIEELSHLTTEQTAMPLTENNPCSGNTWVSFEKLNRNKKVWQL